MKYVPNALTIIRILITPLVLFLLLADTLMGYVWAFVLFVLASISDYLDGKLARYYQVGSRLGQFLDPFADKVLVLGTFVTLAFIIPEIVPWWGVALIALRDVVVTGLRVWAEANGRSIRTMKAAKIKTTFQLTFLIGVLLLLALAGLPGAPGQGAQWLLQTIYLYIFMIIVVVVTVLTGVQYLMHVEYTSPANLNG